MFFGCNERGLASKRSGGTGEKPIAVSSNKIAAEKISIGAGLRTVQRTYFRTSSKSQSCCCTGILPVGPVGVSPDRKSTRLNSSHVAISYAVFCLKKKKSTNDTNVSIAASNM